jgi:hypothetical protein
LTKLAGKVATDAAERKNFRAGVKMIERFFLDRVNRKARRFSVGKQSHITVSARSNTANPGFTFGKGTVSRTKIALSHDCYPNK